MVVKKNCMKVKSLIEVFLQNKLKLNLNLDKTKITFAENGSTIFLVYQIYKTKLKIFKIQKVK